jgi:small-conductance mechanosensitive channel/CRP-like cAMP-binding protein
LEFGILGVGFFFVHCSLSHCSFGTWDFGFWDLGFFIYHCLMVLTQELILDVGRAVALGLGVALLLWLFKGYTVIRRVRVTVILGLIAFIAYLIIHDSGMINAEVFARAAAAAGILLAVQLATQLIDLVIWEGFLAHRRHIAVPRLLVDLFNFAALVATALLLLNRVFEVDLSGLLITSTVLSAVLGLALQDMLGNVIAGVALQLERPFEVGDWVKVSGQEGQVRQVSWRTLTLHTLDNHNIFLPNANAARQDITNFSRPTPLQRQHVKVNLNYHDAPSVVKDVLKRSVLEAEGVLSVPEPEVVIHEFGDYAIHYIVYYWIDDYARVIQINDAVLHRVWYGLGRAALSIPYPSQHLTLRQLSDDYESQMQERLRREVFRELRGLDVFSPLSDAQIESLARNSVIHRYSANEVLVRQGEAGDSLFTIKSGRVRVDVRDDKGQVITVDTIEADGFFGEMSLLTGEPRSASIIAETETEVVVVDKAAFAEVLKSDSNLPDALSRELNQRLQNAVVRASIRDTAVRAKPVDQQTALIKRIRGFFKL